VNEALEREKATSEVLRTSYGASNCVAGEVQLEQVRDVVVKYLQDHAAIRHWPAAYLAITAITEAWCSKTADVPQVNFR
jgi:hypothetical protein